MRALARIEGNIMKFKKGTHVYTADARSAGVVDRVVLNPTTGEVTDIIVRKGLIFSEDKVVSIDLVETAENERVTLNKPASELHDLPPFEEPYYVPAIDVDWHGTPASGTPYVEPLYLYPPVGVSLGVYDYPPVADLPNEPYSLDQVQRNTPEGTLAVREGTHVYSSDGKHVGDIDDVFVDEKTNRVTHFVIAKGVLFKEHKLIPLNWTRPNTEEEIILTVPTEVVQNLPEYEP